MASPSRLSSFPIELVIEICKLLTEEDVRAVRFLSKQFAAAGLDCLMESRYLVLQPMSIERLDNIANDPVCGGLVRCLCYGMDTYVSPLESKPPRYPLRNAYDISDSSFPSLNSTLLIQHLINEIAMFQRELAANAVKRRSILAQILQQLPNLRELYLESKLALDWFDIRSRGAYGSSVLNLPRSHLRIYQHGADQLEDFLILAANNAKSLKSLTAVHVPWAFFETLVGSNKIHEFENTLHRLENLRMTIRIGWGFLKPKEENQYIPLTAFLSKGIHLEAITLDFDCVTEISEALAAFSIPPKPLFFDLTDAFSKFDWPRLRSLWLSQVGTTAVNMLEFLHNHAKSLKVLVLTNITLTSGSWVDTFDEIARITNLDHLQLEQFFMETEQEFDLESTIIRDGIVELKTWRADYHLPLYLLCREYSLGQILTGDDRGDSNMKSLAWWRDHGMFDEDLWRVSKSDSEAIIPTLCLRG